MHIYYPGSMGGGVKRLFRKASRRSMGGRGGRGGRGVKQENNGKQAWYATAQGPGYILWTGREAEKRQNT